MAGEGADMQKPSWFSTNLTLGNVLVLVTMTVGGAVIYGRLENTIETQAITIASLKADFAKMDDKLDDLPRLNFRVTAQEEALKATNQRVDVSLSNISQRLAEINQALGGLDTKVAVLTQRIELQTSTGRRADAATPR
ncbi:hypothetical protein [Aureimonas sp. N4]|uniref:hypothetical protein n=1 Tax=Aureimonas sp. N4 TaxID=1638165 RepID=UPI000B30E402|nr:hypothetical protein [Aureimonas sp. N4]